MRSVVLLVLAALSLLACSDSTKEKELALRERELAVREKELAGKGTATAAASAPAPSAAPAASAPSPEPETPTPSSEGAAAAAKAEKPITGYLVDVLVEVTVDVTKLDGNAWDAGGGKPDPAITLRQTSGGRTWTQNTKDSFTVGVSAERVRVPKDGESFTVSAVDKDVASDDDIGTASGFSFKGKNGVQEKRGGAMKVKMTFSRALAMHAGDMDH